MVCFPRSLALLVFFINLQKKLSKKKFYLCVILASFFFEKNEKEFCRKKKKLEVRGFDPRASPMRTVRSTN